MSCARRSCAARSSLGGTALAVADMQPRERPQTFAVHELDRLA